ncbi:universal stress protein [Dongia sedimenti]|uniref:Universal stress protein n=1 Tax=Dongia sedimenti TaxID=3064282 RepID=A0ABU0YNP0_9PROT|nr:universal stress protein [Rhodospirillaceae bacterium R-7]
MAETEPTETKSAETPPAQARVFLVVVDDSPELKLAIRYACLRAKKTGGRVAMLHVTAPEDMQEWIGVSRLIKEESRQQAEALMQKMAAEVQKLSGNMPVLYFREGDRRDEVMKLIDEEPSISILVLGASTGPKGPGPLVQALTSKYVGKLRVPMTIVPGQLTNDDIDHIA